MLTLQLILNDKQIAVRANGQESHSFSLLDLGQTDKEWRDFLKDPRPYGGKLFQALFKDDTQARKAFDDLSKQTERTIFLVLESSELDGIAWEYAYHDNAYVVEDFAFIRALPEKERPHSNGRLSKSVERLPLLFIPANPLVDLSGEPMRELDIESEWREMTQYIVKSNAPFDLIELRPATPAALQSVMARFQNGMIAHFSGHGAATKDGAFLLFENENGSSNPLEAREFVREVKDQAWISFLSACQSAVAERTEFGNLARELVKAGVPFALGMQFNLPDLFAPNISGQFYNYLSQGHAVPEAARQARRAVKRENEFYVGMIALYVAHPDEAGKIGWSGSGARTLSTFAAADVSDLPTPSGFIGRQRELMNIGTSLLGKKKPNTVTLHGAGGIGKTALMRQALLRFAPSFDAALAITLDPQPSLESVLGRLERFLNLASPCSNDTKERQRIVSERLISKRTLLGLDNFETLNYALNEKDSNEAKKAKSLHSFFKYLAANGVTLCVTSREVTNLGGEVIIDIEGLPNETGGRLFQDSVVKQKGKIYIKKTQQVSEMVGGHPLALRLLASAFDDQVGASLDQYIEDLQSHLPKARDKWTEEDRHESLRASFDFTMNNLVKTKEGKELRVALSRLSVFIAFFFDQIAAPVLENQFPENEEESKQILPEAHKTLHTLWERGLLERTFIPLEIENFYLYHVHPALRYFARERLTEFETVKENYLKSMSFLARVAEEQMKKSSLIAQIVLRTLPDLQVAAESKEDQDTAIMQHRVGKFLERFGFYDDSLSLFEKSRNINQSFNNRQGEAVLLGDIASIEEMRGNLERAVEMQKRKFEITESIGDWKEAIKALIALSNIYVTRGDFDEAMKLCKQSLEINDGIVDLKVKSSTLQGMAHIFFMRGYLDEAMKLCQQSLEIEEGLDNLDGKAIVIGNMGVIEAERGNIDKALEMQKQKLEIVMSLGNQREIMISLHNLADNYKARGDFDEAMKLYKKALKIEEELGALKEKSTTLSNMALILRLRSDLDGAMKLYLEALEIKDRLGELQGKSATLAMLGQLLVEQKEYPRAIEVLVDSLKILSSIGARSDAEKVVKVLLNTRQKIGIENFDNAWKEATDQPMHDLLLHQP